MADIKDWNTVAAQNNMAPPDGWPEGQAPSTVNDCAREMMAAIKRRWLDAEWFDHGHTITRTGNTTFQVTTTDAANVTGVFRPYRRIKAYDTTTIYGMITASTYAAPNNNITIVPDTAGQNLTANLSAVALSVISPIDGATPLNIGRIGVNVASAATTNIGLSKGDILTITGNATINSLGNAPAGMEKTLVFTGTPTLTHSVPQLDLLSKANIVVAAGDIARFRSYGGSNWTCTSYERASGEALVQPAPPAAGDWILIGSANANNSASISFNNLDNTYWMYVLVAEAICATNDVGFAFRVSTNNGGTYLTTNIYSSSVIYTASTAGAVSNQGTNAINMGRLSYVGAGASINNTHPFFSVTNLMGIGRNTGIKSSSVIYYSTAGSGTNAATNTVSTRANANNVNAIQFLMTSGNITSGTFKLYGVRA